MVPIVEILCPENKYKIKCPYSMTATRIVIHNTANDATARNEVSYMLSNNKQTSFHFAVDDKEIVKCIPLNRNAFHAGDGNGKGNREGIGIEICYSKSGGALFEVAQRNAAELTAKLLLERGWGIGAVTKHQDYSGKYCPHRTLSDYGWEYFLNLVRSFMKDQWIKDDNGWWYRHADGTYTKNGWEKIGEEWFYFDGNGYAAKENTWLKLDGRWYYFNERNAAVKGLHRINGALYYFVEKGTAELYECQLIMTDSNGAITPTV